MPKKPSDEARRRCLAICCKAAELELARESALLRFSGRPPRCLFFFASGSGSGSGLGGSKQADMRCAAAPATKPATVSHGYRVIQRISDDTGFLPVKCHSRYGLGPNSAFTQKWPGATSHASSTSSSRSFAFSKSRCRMLRIGHATAALMRPTKIWSVK